MQRTKEKVNWAVQFIQSFFRAKLKKARNDNDGKDIDFKQRIEEILYTTDWVNNFSREMILISIISIYQGRLETLAQPSS